MTRALRLIAALLFALPLCAQAQRLYSQPELDQMLAPVALYPDSLLRQVLAAATRPEEVREAAAWLRANPGLEGDEALRAAQYAYWDPSVKSLAAFPQLLAQMDQNPDWTRSLGEAFRLQEPYVMDTVQQLRRRAQAAGNLQSSEQLYVQQQGQRILVQSASPAYVYVPYYDPLIVYGSWWWSAHRPVHWAPRQHVQPPRPQLPPPQPQAHSPRPQLQPQARMPAAVAPQQPRAVRVEPRHEHRGEPRNHHAPRGRERS